MKKISIAATVLLSCMASGAMAQDTFHWLFMGGEVHHSKHSYDGMLSSNARNETQKKIRQNRLWVTRWLRKLLILATNKFCGTDEVKLRTGGSKITSNNNIIQRKIFFQCRLSSRLSH